MQNYVKKSFSTKEMLVDESEVQIVEEVFKQMHQLEQAVHVEKLNETFPVLTFRPKEEEQ